MQPNEDKLRPPARRQSELSPEEPVDEEAADLPERDAMTLLDPGLLGGMFSPSGGLPTGMPTADGGGTGLPATDSTAPVAQTAADAQQLASQHTPPPDASQPYQPTASDIDQS